MKRANRGVAAACALAVALASSGCATTSSGSKTAFAEAGRQVRRQQPPPTNRELLEEVDRYLADDLAFLQEKAKTREEKQANLWKVVGAGGVGLGIAGLSIGGGTAADVLGGIGLATALFALVEYYTQTGKMHGCQAYLGERAAILRGWANRKLKDNDDPVPPEVWHEWVDQTAEIEAYPKCLPVR